MAYHSRLRNDSTELDEPKRHPIILNVGHVAQRKGQHLLATAFAKIARRFPEWSLQFAGPDHDQITAKAIRTLARESNLEGRIQLLDRRDDTSQLMQQAAIYVQPSYLRGTAPGLAGGWRFVAAPRLPAGSVHMRN